MALWFVSISIYGGHEQRYINAQRIYLMYRNSRKSLQVLNPLLFFLRNVIDQCRQYL